MPLGIEQKRHRKTECDCGNKDRQNPFGRAIGEHYRRADLYDEARNHRVAQCDAINLPLFQLTEERAHLGPRRPYSVAHFRHVVESATGHAKFQSRSHEGDKTMDIEAWEYNRVLANPQLYYFSTLFKLHNELHWPSFRRHCH